MKLKELSQVVQKDIFTIYSMLKDSMITRSSNARDIEA